MVQKKCNALKIQLRGATLFEELLVMKPEINTVSPHSDLKTAVLINSLQAVLTAAICALWFHHEDGICWYIDRYRYITLYNLRALYL